MPATNVSVFQKVVFLHSSVKLVWHQNHFRSVSWSDRLLQPNTVKNKPFYATIIWLCHSLVVVKVSPRWRYPVLHIIILIIRSAEAPVRQSNRCWLFTPWHHKEVISKVWVSERNTFFTTLLWAVDKSRLFFFIVGDLQTKPCFLNFMRGGLRWGTSSVVDIIG